MTIQEAVAYYKKKMDYCWPREKYKWIAVQHFQQNWNLEAEDFAEMLERSLAKAGSLLSGGMYYPKMIIHFAKMNPEKVRDLFQMLFNEEIPLVERLQPFRNGCDELLQEYRAQAGENTKAKNHYQDLRALCVYLTFRYPEKYYLFKYTMYAKFLKLTGYMETSTETDSEIRKYDNYARMCEEVICTVQKDSELQQMQNAAVKADVNCYPDSAYHMLAQTIIFVNDYYPDENGAVSDVREENVNDTLGDEEKTGSDFPPYDADEFLREVYLSEKEYEELVDVVETKKNVILQGAPGVGKTYAAKRLAYSMMGEKDPSRVMMVQFHQSYSYEDFIMGYRPTASGFELRHGAFYQFCKIADADPEHQYFFIIDEINRGNLSKIFGELFMLIEEDKRGLQLKLTYADELFSVPDNLYILGMMNTADRSLALLDFALRRRFGFYVMKPAFKSEGFRSYQEKLHNEKFDRLVTKVEKLNQVITEDDSLGEGFCIGHSYFCNLRQATERDLSRIVEYELIPLLKEYWFDEPTKVRDWSNQLRGVIQ